MADNRAALQDFSTTLSQQAWLLIKWMERNEDRMDTISASDVLSIMYVACQKIMEKAGGVEVALLAELSPDEKRIAVAELEILMKQLQPEEQQQLPEKPRIIAPPGVRRRK